MKKAGVGAFQIGMGEILEHTGENQRIGRAELCQLLELATERGAAGVGVVAAGGRLATGRIARRRNALHAVEKAVDIGAMKWRAGPPKAGNGAAIARITFQGEEVMEAMKGGGKTRFVEAIATGKLGAELIVSLKALADAFWSAGG